MIFQSHCAGCDRVGPVLCRTCRFALARPSSLPAEPRRDRRRAVHRPCPRRAARLQVRQSPAARRTTSPGCSSTVSIAAGVRPADLDVVTWAPTSTTTAVPPRVRPGRGRRPPSGCSARAAVPAPARTRRPRHAHRPAAAASIACTVPSFGPLPALPVGACSSSTTSSLPDRRCGRRRPALRQAAAHGPYNGRRSPPRRRWSTNGPGACGVSAA